LFLLAIRRRHSPPLLLHARRVDGLTQQIETRVENGQRRLVVVRFSDGFDEHGHVTAEVIHPKQESADGGRPDRHRHGLHEYSEQDTEPHFGCTKRT